MWLVMVRSPLFRKRRVIGGHRHLPWTIIWFVAKFQFSSLAQYTPFHQVLWKLNVQFSCTFRIFFIVFDWTGAVPPLGSSVSHGLVKPPHYPSISFYEHSMICFQSIVSVLLVAAGSFNHWTFNIHSPVNQSFVMDIF